MCIGLFYGDFLSKYEDLLRGNVYVCVRGGLPPGVLQCVAVCYCVLQCFAVSCSVLQCVVVCCSDSTC